MFANTFVRSARSIRSTRKAPVLRLRGSRNVSTLAENPHIYVHKHPLDPRKSLLSLLPTNPPTPQLAIGTCEALPVTPNNFTPNPSFLPILSSVFATYATSDPYVVQQASAYASPGGSNLSQPSDGAGGANHQGGAGGAGHGGWIHVSDVRNPPDYGRIAWPEDILGSVEVDGNGQFSDGTWQDSGTYRIVTREGILGLTEFMRGKMVERLQQLEREIKQKS
ncbi:Nn.00g012970.m01.CDS01 [Neocucurbitaria sp. VM-36]